MTDKQAENRGSQFQKGNEIGKETRWKKGQVVSKLFQLAERGDLRAIQFIVERLEGKALDRQERTTKSEPIQVMVIDE